MTLTELKYIVAVARERHFGRAAEACFISQPTLSVAVKKLESELGVTLFERGQGEVNLTAVGELVVAQAQRVLEEAGVISEIAQQNRDQLAAPLRLGAIFTIGPYLFPDLVPRLAERAPQMPLIIEEGYTSTLAEKLKQGQLDMIIISLPFDEPGLLTLPVYREPFVILLPAAHPLTQQEKVSVADLGQEQVLLLGSGHCFRDQVLAICPECLPKRGPVAGSVGLEGGSLETIRYMVASGLGITILPCSAAGAGRFSERLLTIRRIEGLGAERTVAVAWRKSFPRSQAINAVVEAVRACGLTCVEPIRR